MKLTDQKILLVEDSEKDQQLIQSLLVQANYRINCLNTVTSLEQAVQKLNEYQFDIILLDLVIEDSRGMNTFHNVNRQVNGNVPIVIITNMSDFDFALEAIQAGAEDYTLKSELNKPLLEKTLLYAIERHKIIQKLNQLNQRMDSYIHSISHDLKGSVFNMNILMQMYHNENEVEKPNILGNLDTSIRKLVSIMNNLSDAIDSQTPEEKKKPIFFESLIDEVIFILSDQIKEKGAVINKNIECPTIFFKKAEIYSLFYNLISNAIKYSKPETPPHINIKTDHTNDQTNILISDNGLGIDLNKYKEKIFDKNYRISEYQHVNGSGKGLYIVHSIIQNNNGKLNIDSREGEGTTFYITL